VPSFCFGATPRRSTSSLGGSVSPTVVSDPPIETAVVHHATVTAVARYLNPAVPWVWVLDHVPNSRFQWWSTEVPLNQQGATLVGDVRLLRYDLQLPTQEFLSCIEAFEEHGISLVHSRHRMPNTLEPSRLGSDRHQVLRLNGALLTIDLPHAGETAVVSCYEPGYLSLQSYT
jgi:hypothetical protein